MVISIKMRKSNPIQNKLLQKKWVAYERELHSRKLERIKPQIEIGSPVRYFHMRQNKKKEIMIEGNN